MDKKEILIHATTCMNLENIILVQEPDTKDHTHK